ncbi:Ras-specific guanine nucleotide-releasing factor RalGPS1 [Operophtera brumata]|uniref:Ras-specific guanine nucleotide-releasing factor RalGPS1 n=1 Tax=Operophtera brumata TaxID=104452 RepID=A0A0L7KSY7_OPEBR|nr:Ras-specific guanine nucleotide-releasing factor RalGPS1 [Operophtera brumata]
MPRDILSDSLAVLRIVEAHKKQSNIPLNSQQPYTKDDCACYYNYAHGDNGASRQSDPVYQYKTSSLPAASSMNQSWDDIVCSALRLTPEDIANQLTLLDLPCFKNIRPEELTTCGWNKLNKLTLKSYTNSTIYILYLLLYQLCRAPEYTGIFLTDLVYIDIAHPAGSPHRTAKMAVVLKALERYQTSEYDITLLPHVANYLNSVRYIEELQKFLVDDQFKLSLKLEPPSPIGSCVGSKESVKEGIYQATAGPFNESPSKIGSGSLRLQGSCHQGRFVPTHRKCRSLGSKFRSASLPRNFHKVNFGVGIFGKGHTDEKMDEKTPAGSVNLLDDTNLSKLEELPCDFQGFVRRKTLLKDGRKISLSSWQRYWLQMSENILVFYASKSFKGSSRSDFRAERCKVLPLDGWRAKWDADAPDAFQLINHCLGTLYKFKTGSEPTAKQWVTKVEEISNKTMKPLPANLMSFE